MPLSRLLVFLGILTSVLFLVHLYVWFKVVRGAGFPPPWGRVATIVLFTLCASIPLLFVLRDSAPRGISSAMAWVVYSWMGFLFYLFAFGLISDALRGMAFLTGNFPQDPVRRSFLTRLLAGGVGAAALATGLGGMLHVARGFRIKNIRIPLAKLPTAADGYVIAQLTDVHVGPTIGRGFIEDVVRETNALNPDLIAITGDLVDGTVDALRDAVAPLAGLKARDGVYFVTGNHEYYSGADAWIAHLETLGIRVLRNERVDIRGLFDLAGVDDAKSAGMAPGHGQDVAKAMVGRDPAKAVVLLAHQPKSVLEAGLNGVDLQLSGHVHGGQIWPFTWLAHLDQPYLHGLYHHGNTTIYVSQGTGYWGPPMRVGTTSEITRVELAAAT